MRYRAITLALLSSIACGQPHASADDKAPAKPPATLAQTELDKLSPAARVVATYLDLHKALAADAAHLTKARFDAVLAAARDKAAVADEGARARMLEAATAGSVAKDLEAARKAFDALSKAMIDWLRAVPNPYPNTVHLAHCPMALDNGAKWLQQSDKVENPYYGAEMFTCGRIQAKAPSGAKLPAQ
jgi:membrane fusion protein, copper/silver efflux system